MKTKLSAALQVVVNDDNAAEELLLTVRKMFEEILSENTVESVDKHYTSLELLP